jgi:hypothetical protein
MQLQLVRVAAADGVRRRARRNVRRGKRLAGERYARMNWSPRTLLRVFLLVGGLAFTVMGTLEGSLFNLALGAVAAFLGLVGLWMEYRGGVHSDNA